MFSLNDAYTFNKKCKRNFKNKIISWYKVQRPEVITALEYFLLTIWKTQFKLLAKKNNFAIIIYVR